MGTFFAQYPAVGGSAASNASVGTNGLVAPTSSTEIGGINPSGNLQPVSVDGSGNVNVNVISAGPENVVSATGTLTNAGDTCCNVLTNGASTISIQPSGTWGGLIALQGSTDGTTFVQIPLFDYGSRTAQLYISSNVIASADVGGFLRIRLIAVTSLGGTATLTMYGNSGQGVLAVTSATPASFYTTSNIRDTNGNALNATNGALNVQPPVDVVDATQNITVVDTGSGTSTNANGQVWYTGTPTAGSFALFPLSSNASGQVEVTGTWTGTLQVEISVDQGTTYIAHSIHQIGSPNFVSTFTQNIIGSINLSGKTQLRVRATAAMTGTAVIHLLQSSNVGSVYVANAIKVVTGDSSTTATPLTIKAASTAAAATDAAVVVGLSPNSPLPAGANALGSVSVSNFPGTQPVSGTVTVVQPTGTNLHTVVDSSALPTGASTSALQTTGNSSLATIATNTTGASTSALQTTGNTSLATIATNTTNLTVAQGSTSSGQTGQLVQGATTTAAPTYTTGTTNPLSLNAAGGLRVDGSGVTQPISGTVTANTPSGTASGTISTQNLNPTSGTATAGSTVQISAINYTNITISVSGTYTGAQTVQGSFDNVNWNSIGAFYRLSNGAMLGPTFPGGITDILQVPCGGLNYVRVSANAAFTGSYTLSMNGDTATTGVMVNNSVNVTQSSGGTTAQSWTTKITDGTNGPAAVKAASTAAVAADPSLVVQLSPNSPAIAQASKGTVTDGSGSTSATPSTATTLFAINASRKYMFIQNLSSSANLYINFTSAATASTGSIVILPYGSFVQEASYVSTELVSVLATVASVPYTAKQG